MDSPLSSGSAAQALPEATNSLIRFFTVKKSISAEPLLDPIGKWEPSTPEAAKGFSAVAYFFAREIYASQKVPHRDPPLLLGRYPDPNLDEPFQH